MIPHPGCLPAPNRQHRHPDLPVFQKKTIGFQVPEGHPLFSGNSGRRRAPEYGTEHRLSGFCAFSPAAKKHVFFAIKTVIFRKQRYKRIMSGGVGTISTAEFFRDPAPGSLRRKGGCRGLTVFPIRGCIWREQCQGMWMRGAGSCEQGPDKKIIPDRDRQKYFDCAGFFPEKFWCERDRPGIFLHEPVLPGIFFKSRSDQLQSLKPVACVRERI